MKKLFSLGRVLLVSVVMAMSLPGHALFYAEPYGGQTIADYGQVDTQGDNPYGSFNGFTLGGRFGTSVLSLFTGLELSYTAGGSLESSGDDFSSSGDKKSAELMQFGPFLGWVMPMAPMRFYFTYFFHNKLSYDDSPSNGALSGAAFKFGMGMKFFPLVSANIEYVHHRFDERETGDGRTITYPDGNRKEPRINALVVNLSLPLDL